jgi:CRP-like cAMP-binding protein
LSSATARHVLAQWHPVDFAPGELLVWQGDTSDCAYLILEGEADVPYVVREVVPARLSRGVLIGEICVFAELSRNTSVRACSGPALRLPLGRGSPPDPFSGRRAISSTGAAQDHLPET